MKFKPEDFAGAVWTDASDESHFINEVDAAQLAEIANAKLEEWEELKQRLMGGYQNSLTQGLCPHPQCGERALSPEQLSSVKRGLADSAAGRVSKMKKKR